MTNDYQQKINADDTDSAHLKSALLDVVGGLAVARSNLRDQQENVASTKEILTVVTEWQDFSRAQQNETAAKQVAQMWELKLRALLVKAYIATGIKKFGDGLTIREMSGVRLIDREQALGWILKEARHLIKVDERELVAIAKRQDIPGVELFKTPKASIARDLSRFESKEIGGTNE